jgi:hypothetical protein
MWPGLDSEGLAWFADMTRPAVEWGTWETPFGVAGALLPLAIFGCYVRTVEYTSVGGCHGGSASQHGRVACAPCLHAEPRF